MSFKILADTFTVSRDTDHFIQVKTVKKPRFAEQVWLAIEIDGETKYARSIVQNMVEIIEDVFFDKTELSGYERFENTLKEINVIIKNLKEKKGASSLGAISAILAVFDENELLLTQSKNAEAYLIRRGKLSTISEGLGSSSEDLFVNIASGELKADDKVILATSRLLRVASQSQLVQLLSEGVTESIDALRELVMAENELSIGVGCVHVRLPQRLGAVPGPLKQTMIVETVKKWVQQFFAAVNAKTGGKLPKPKINLPAINLGRKGVLVALVGVVLLLVISVSLLMDSRRNQALRAEYRQRIEAMNQDLQVANTKGYANEKETANAILDNVEREARDILGANYFRDEVMILLEKVQATRDSINNTIRLKEPKPYVDLSVKNASVKAIGLVNMDENFFAYAYDTLYEVILDQVLEPKLIDETEVAIASAAMEDQGVVVFLTQSGRLLEYKDGQFSFANTDDTGWKSGSAIAAYGRNLYLLNPEANQIYKYSRLRSSYSGASDYNADADVKEGISMAIDGNVYVLKKGGEIVKLFKSKVQPFAIEDAASDLSTVTKIFTTTDLENLYLLDPVKKQIVIIEKDRAGLAHYVGQVVFGELPAVNDFYVDKSESSLYLLTDQQIYKVEL